MPGKGIVQPIGVCVCPDTFKGTLSSVDVCAQVAKGMAASRTLAFTVDQCPMSDGGRGFLAASTAALGADLEVVLLHNVVHPYYKDGEAASPASRITASYGYCASRSFAVIEMAEAAGLHQAPAGDDDKNPLEATSFGVGQLILAAVEKMLQRADSVPSSSSQKKRIMIGLGGSCTNDAGIGCLQALGATFTLDNTKTPAAFPLKAKHLGQITSCDFTLLRQLRAQLASAGIEIELVSDVSNPLLGPEGATRIYGKQKGVSSEARMLQLEHGIAHAVVKMSDARTVSTTSRPGAGAAGGLGWALLTHFGGKVQPGAETFCQMIGLERRIAEAHIVFSGEGSFDSQTIEYGKTVAFVAGLCKKYGKSLVVLCGICDAAAAASAAQRVPAVRVVSLVDLYGKEASLNRTAESVEKAAKSKLVEEVIVCLQTSKL